VTVDRTTDTAGAGSPAPAVSSVPPDHEGPGGAGAWPASVDVVAPEARVELDRIRRRWAELPLDRAESRMPLLRHLLADLAPRSSRLIADPSRPEAARVPDLGPAVVVDQLTVLVWDAYAAGRGDGIPELLVAARRALA
jgi:hypothetical protein